MTALAKDISHKDEALAENHPTLGWCEDWEGLHRAMGRLFIGVLRDVQPPGHRWILYRGCQEPVNLSLYPRAARVDWSAISFDYEPAIFESRLWQPDVNEWMDSCLHGLLWPEKKVVKGRSFDPYPDKSLAQVIRNCPVWFDMGFDFDAVTFYATSPEWMERVERAVNDVTREFALEGD
ncbi:MAG: hypothetical protein KY468_12735 [Armatimonadetes bacterium]|nr:hypothetical protein [Armatimonadota bacterium]